MAAKKVNLDALHATFPADDIEWRLQQSGEKNGRFWGMCLAYITNRAIMARLDSVIGPANWKNEFKAGPEGGVMCGISIRVDRGIEPAEWVTKWDGAENTDVEEVKGGLSSAMKRAAVQWGIGRYLYNLSEGWAVVSDEGQRSGRTKDGKYFKWDPPRLPEWALPSMPGPYVEAAVAYIREFGPKVPETENVVVNDEAVSLRKYVREHWAALKTGEDSSLSLVLDAIAMVTGEPAPSMELSV